ncbi:MAG: cytochrome c oxidase subunit 3 [Candidatus Kapabacteria bacterium]|nr:cytochrome c oxidase subunit 3 [Candidatus Kapabacteria bacterium]
MENQRSLSVPIIRVPQGRLAMWVLIAGELMIFGGLIACYLLYRLRYPEWADQAAHTSTLIGALNTIVLLTSSFTVVKAHEAANKMDLKKVVLWLSVSIGGGLLFLVNKGIEYTTEISHGFTFSSPHLQAGGDTIGSLFWSFYFFMTGLHGAHVIAGMVVMFLALLNARKGKNLHRVELAGMYWHMVDLIWIVLFPLLYIAK